MNGTMRILVAAAILVCFAVISCGGETSTQHSMTPQELMTPQEVAQTAETTSLDSEEFLSAWGSIIESVEQMSQEQLAEVFAAIILPEEGITNDLRLPVLMMTTDHISAAVLETWRHKAAPYAEVETAIGGVFASHPFLLQAVIDQARAAAEKAKSEAEQMEEGEERNNILLQAANLYNLVGNCLVLMAHLLDSMPQGPSPGTPGSSYANPV